ncbi:MAG TPA: DedA family protein [Dehalococcoidia bacterium]|nr:DedA family protein [Dehalococcoidia bacterium]
MRGGGPLLHGVEQSLLHFITNVYDAIGWPGVILMMAIESAAVPLPSEVIMPLAGWKLIADKGRGWEWILLAGFFGAVGNTIGSWVAYYVGLWGGRPAAEKYGKYILVSRHDLDLADRFFARWGNWAIFGSRLLPVVRTFISVPAGIARMPIWQFTLYTFAGAFIWSTGLAWGGYKLGQNYDNLRNWMRPLDYPIAGIILLAVVWYIYRHIKRAWGDSGPEAAS